MIKYSENDFNIKELGSFYYKDKTIFRVFAPESKNVFVIIDDKQYSMKKNNYTFEAIIDGDFHLHKYYFINDKNKEFRDPFAYCSDEKYSYILDKSLFNKEKIDMKPEDNIIIYETSVRDFSCDDLYIGDNKRKLLALKQSGLKIEDKYSIGLDYLKELGITYLQLMPILDFDLARKDYNWGYNPLAFNYIYSGYISDQNNLYAHVNEFREVVNELHKNNIRVCLDVVFNHVYKIHEYDMHKMIPGHVFRLKEDKTYAKGSLCGNEVNTEDPFVREYFIEMISRYIELFDIDGIRIDQMGLSDYRTVDKFYIESNKIKKGFIVYGEGWNMGDVLPENMRAAIINSDKIKNVGMFNDYFRDTIINYICGNKENRQDVKNVLNEKGNMLYTQSLNYVECHDNITFFDRMIKYKEYDGLENNIKKCKLALAIILVARGIPFIHSGQEFLRTKKLIENSYNCSEEINKIDWKRRVQYSDICDYLKNLIDIRKTYKDFIDKDATISFSDYNECIIYNINDIKVIINASDNDYSYNDGNNYEVLLDENNKKHYYNNTILIPSYSLIIVRK